MMENKKDSSPIPTHHRSKKNKTMEDNAIEAQSGDTPNIPQEIIEEILVILPARSLLKFRCVSKSWLSLISSPKFIKTHVAYSSLDPALSNYRLLLGVSYDPIRDELKHDSVSSIVLHDLLTDVVKNVDCPNEHREWEFRLYGSCNGLLCVSVYRDDVPMFLTFLWNPCLGMSKKLPPVTSPEMQMNWVCQYVIGYDEPNDDYKVVGFFWYICNVANMMKLMVQIYSLKNDSWKRIDDFGAGRFTKSPSVVFANGKFHFLETFGSSNSSIELNIVSLDLADEAYGSIAQPKRDGGYSRVSMVVLKGCISAVYGYEWDRVDVWVLREYGVAESWSKLVSIPYADGLSSDYAFPYRLCILWNGKYLVDCCMSHPVVYDPKDNSFVYPQNGNVAEICSTGLYAESLVALPI